MFVIAVFPYTHDTGAVTGTDPGDEFCTLPLTEINIAAFRPFNSTLCIRDATEFWTSTSRGIMTIGKLTTFYIFVLLIRGCVSLEFAEK